jgi:hypothetical protein
LSSSVGFIRELRYANDALTIALAHAVRPTGVIQGGLQPTPANAEALAVGLRRYLATLSARGLVPLLGPV